MNLDPNAPIYPNSAKGNAGITTRQHLAFEIYKSTILANADNETDDLSDSELKKMAARSIVAADLFIDQYNYQPKR